MEGYSKQQKEVDEELIAIAEELQITMKTPGWQKVVQPLIDKMIKDSMGYKTEDGRWEEGAIALEQEDLSKVLWYRKALIEFNNHLQAHFKESREAKARVERYKEGVTQQFKTPMKDTRYANSPERPDKITEKYGGGLISA